MLQVTAVLDFSVQDFRKLGIKGERYDWVDRYAETLHILSPDPDPWGKTWDILFRLSKGKTRGGAGYPRRMDMVLLAPAPQPNAVLLRRHWKGLFAHSVAPSLLFAAFPVENDRVKQDWIMLSVHTLPRK